MVRVVSEALALRRTPFGETSQVAEFLTRDRGRLALILKGVHEPKSRKGGGVDLLDHCRLTWVQRPGSRALAALAERRVLSHHPGLRRREDLSRAGQYLVELLRDLTPEGQPLSALFDLAVSCVDALDAAPPPEEVPALVFALEGGILRLTGFEQVLDRCVVCERRPQGHRALRCDPGRGGVVCSACRQDDDRSFPLSADAARAIRALSGADPRQLGRTVLPPPVERDVRRFFDRTYEHLLERRPRCRPWLARGAAAARGVAVALLLLASGCSSTRLPEADLLPPLEAAAAYRDAGDGEEALFRYGQVADDPAADLRDRAEAAFQAAELELAEGEHLQALRRYRYVLENAPWSAHSGLIEARLFELAEAFFTLDRYEGWIFSSRPRGVEALELAQAHFQRSERADDALRRVGDFFASDEEAAWLEAALSYERLYEEYPQSEWAEKALWMAGHCRLQQCQGAAYDRDGLLRAHAVLERSREVFPRGSAAQQTKDDLATVRQLLAEAELRVADFYARRAVAEGERLRLANAWALYPDTAGGLAAKERLLALGLDPDALARDPRRNSIDAAHPSPHTFDTGGGVFGFGF